MFLLFSTVIIPATICFSTTVLIYRHVQSLANRAQTGAAATTTCPRRISRRDVGLLGHTAIVFAIFAIGWAPGIIIYIVEYYRQVNELVVRIFDVIFKLALLIDVMDLFVYNHKVRKYLTGLCLLAFRRPR